MPIPINGHRISPVFTVPGGYRTKCETCDEDVLVATEAELIEWRDVHVATLGLEAFEKDFVDDDPTAHPAVGAVIYRISFPAGDLRDWLDQHEVYDEASWQRDLTKLYSLLREPRTDQWLAEDEGVYMRELALSALTEARLIELVDGEYRRVHIPRHQSAEN